MFPSVVRTWLLIPDQRKVHYGIPIDQVGLDKFSGKCFVLEYSGQDMIPREYFEKQRIPEGVDKILIKTTNSSKNFHSFDKNFIALNQESVSWFVERKIQLVGIDGPSIQAFHDQDNKTHEVLLGNQITILENLDLSQTSRGSYELFAFPIKLKGFEGAPVRAVLTKE